MNWWQKFLYRSLRGEIVKWLHDRALRLPESKIQEIIRRTDGKITPDQILMVQEESTMYAIQELDKKFEYR